MSCSPASSSPKLSNSNSLSNLRSAGISVPSRPSGHIRKDSSGSINEQSASHSQSKEHAASGAFTPGGAVPSGYSYLTRSHSLVTATRSRPRGMDSQPQSPKQSTDQSIPRSVTTDSVFTASQGRSQHSTSRPLPPIPTSQSSSSIQNKTSVGSNSPSPLPSPSLTQSQGAPPRRSKTIHSFPSNEELGGIKSDAETLEALVSQLPPNPKQWTPSQVALYLSHVLGLTPRPIVEDVTAYVRNSRMGGRVFLRLREEDLEKEGLNLKWRSLMMEAVRKLRRNCLRGRIWGFQGSAGSGWPRTLGDEEEIPAPRDIEGHVLEEPDENPESSKTNNKGTLKRLRERRRVRGMIQALDSASENGMEDEEEGFVALGHGGGSRSGSGGSFEHRQGSSNGNGSPRQVMAPIYGHGFVKERAASFTSLSDVENDEQPRRRQARKVEISPAELEEWFGTLSEQEAAALASELEDEDLHGFGDTESESESVGHDEEVGEEKVKETQVINKNQSSHDRAQNNSTGTSSIGSSISGPQTPPPVYVSIEEQEQSMKELLRQSEASAVRQDNPLDQRLGLVLDQDEAVGISTARPRRREVPRNSSNPYRASTYTPEELAALPSDEDAPRFGTARRIPSGGTPAVNESIPSLAQVVADPEAGAEADNESEDEGFTLKRPTPTNSEQVKENSKSIDDLFPPQTYRSARDLFDAPSPPRRALSGEKAEEELEVKDEEIPSVDINSVPIPTASPSPNHMRNMSQHSAAGASPYAPLGRRSSQKKNTSEASTLSSVNKATEAGAQRTLGSKRATQLAALLRAGGVDEETGNPLGAAEEEGKGAWGGTLSRSVSKKTGGRGSLASMMTSTTSSSSTSSTTTTPNKGAAKMLELFSPAKEISDPILENQSEEQVEGDASSKSKADELPIIEEPKLEVVTEESSAAGNTEKLELIEEEIEAQQEIIEAAVAEAAKAEKSGSGLKVRLPMTTLVPSPDGKGSIKKRSMVLVDRARFESLARRMGMLEEQLAALENASEVGSTTSHSRDVSRTKLSDIFNSEEGASENGGSVRSVKDIETQTSGPSTPRKTYAENSVGNDATKVDEEEDEFSESEGWGAFSLGNPKLSLGAIPAYCLGLGAGVGFIILTEVVQRVARR